MNPIFRFFKKLKEIKKPNEAFRKEYKNKTGKISTIQAMILIYGAIFQSKLK